MSDDENNSDGKISRLREEIEENYRGMLEVFYTLGESGQMDDVHVLKEEIKNLTLELDETYRGVIELATNLESDENKIKMLTKGAGLGMWDWQPASDIFNVTDEWLDVAGVDRKSLKGNISDWDNLIHKDDLASVRRARTVFLKGEKMFFHSEHRLNVNNGTWKWFLSNGRALKNSADGRPTMIAGSILDIDNRKRTEDRIQRTNAKLEQNITERTDEVERTNYKLMEEIREHQYAVQALRQSRAAAEAANKAKSIFLANMNHELRTPLHAILGFSQLMQRDPTLSKSQESNLEIINSSGIYLQGLINDVLEVSKIEAGRVSLSPVVFDIREMFQDIESLFEIRLNEKSLYFRTVIEDGLPRYMRGDEGKLRQALINLIGNAIKFTDEGGVELTVKYCATKEPELTVEVKDTGAGISAEELKSLFQPFEQGISGISKGGSGLGLVISREYMELMQGELSVKSELGTGSRFTITCHLDEAESSAIQSLESKKRIIGLKGGFNSKTALVVEDNEINRRLLTQTLVTMGFKTSEAENGKVALEEFSHETPDVVLMDMRMPEMDGKTTIQHIRKMDSGKNIPIIIVTANIAEEKKDELLECGANDLLYKPFRESDLADVLKNSANVEFLYEENELIDGDEGASEDIGKLPENIREELYQATTNGNIVELRNIVDKFENIEPGAAIVVRKLVNSYNYGRLLDLVSR